jgi:hypothetical protein
LLLENSTANKVFVLSSMVASDLASSPFNLVLYIVNYGVFSKWTALLTKLFICFRITSSGCMEFRRRWRQMASQLRFLRPQYQQHGVNRGEQWGGLFALPILKLICNATTSEITKVSVILKMPRYPLIRISLKICHRTIRTWW